MVTCTIANAQQTLMCVLDTMNYYAKGQDFKIKNKRLETLTSFTSYFFQHALTKVKHSSSYSETM